MRIEAAAISSPSCPPAKKAWPNSVFGTSLAVDKQGAADSGAESEDQGDAERNRGISSSGAKAEFGQTGSIGIIENGDRDRQSALENGDRVSAEPFLGQMGSHGDGPLSDDAGKADPNRTLPGEPGQNRFEVVGEDGRRELGMGSDRVPFGQKTAGTGVDRGRFDKAAADVDAENAWGSWSHHLKYIRNGHRSHYSDGRKETGKTRKISLRATGRHALRA